MSEMLPRLRRVNPMAGMKIDVDTWRTAHDYHRDHARLHHRTLHGWGIVAGLDVVIGKSLNALLIQPGVAVDPAGNFVIVDQEQVYRPASRVRGLVYLALRYREAPAEPNAADAGPQTRVLESFSIEERTLPPADDDVELARIDFDPQSAAIRPPVDPQKPGRNELDTRFRVRLSIAGAPLAAPAHGNGQAAATPQVLADVRQRLEGLDQRVEQLAARAEAGPAPDHLGTPAVDGIQQRVEEIARQVAVLWQRPQAITPTEAERGSEAIASDRAPDLVVVEMRQRLEDIPQRVAELGERLQVLGTQQDQLTHLHQGLEDQVGLLVRQGETASPELARLRDRLDTLTPEIERYAASLEPLERQIQQLGERSEAEAERAWQTTDSRSGRLLRLAIGRIRTEGWDQHREGLRLLGRELAATLEPATRVLDEVQLSDLTQVELLYLTGYSALALDEAEVHGIARVLESGGVVLAEGCAAGPAGEAGAREFAFSFIELAQRLGKRLTRVERNHKLFAARHVFADPPAGARPARVLEAEGIIYSDADYGCAWQGGAPQHPLPRGVIRDAFDFGVNMAIYHQARV